MMLEDKWVFVRVRYFRVATSQLRIRCRRSDLRNCFRPFHKRYFEELELFTPNVQLTVE